MSLTFQFEHRINGAPVMFHGTAESAADALATINAVVAGTVKLHGTAETPAGAATGAGETVKQSTAKNNKAGMSRPTNETDPESRSTAEQTQTASGSSGNSSTASSDQNASDSKGNDDAGQDGAALDYDKDVKPVVLQVAKKSRDLCVALLQRHGVSKGTELTARQYPQFIKDAQAVIAGELDPTASADGDIA
ncbi:hypothetical protein CAL26_09885 [Bordetella genomosp. 9]|uniref:Uncharacterized protein n=1 Tax=Bordetella genomosp. 9 TaxID=1416803 RepID=A0A261RFM5_9BORD|nr:hypothetical protein [Bordetella genomosp. 9]OZI23731.1 hypothetical protein CAL26_09885 [Bordetella genomosp. 9]